MLLNWCAEKGIAFSFDTLYQRVTLSSPDPIKRSGDLFLSIVITGEEGEEGSFSAVQKTPKKIFPTFMMTYRRRKKGRDRTAAALLFHFKTEGKRAEEEEEEDLFLFFSFFFAVRGEEGSIFFREG